ncbi:50S ribosomal protein L16 [Methanohalophilus mahii]|jgi:large subunit ribosomal protein L10e|uniref:Large ribosomal subunit protein uL16 n=1 Tax=Methanohalophilus mahii (strain ATCC 35705 / DSM 5219 / SLP) TaxID=547558 RepID=D5E7T9_METMS|nr:50S ribosomal protein L16 [Methanohalophilus mahii]ADE37227.1 LSU ribosomal protein L10AE [Methanohalophilus mahii DSM 5219]
MTRKPASMYRNIKQRSYTRRKYMGGVPGSQVIHYDMGNKTADFQVKMSLISEEKCQMRHTALEAARISANRHMLSKIGRINYHFKLRVYPHEVLRENKQATGAGADRVSSGMRKAFGKAVGTAARVSAGQKIFTVSVNKKNFKHAKAALKRAGQKLPTPIRIVVDEGAELVQ